LKLLHELVHEFLTKAQLPGMLLPFRPELEGVDDAHVEQPPRQTRPAATRFASRGRRGEKPAFGDLGSGEKRTGREASERAMETWPCVIEAQAEMPEWVRATTGDDCTADGAASVAEAASFGAPPTRAFAAATAGRNVFVLWRGSRRATGTEDGAAGREQRALQQRTGTAPVRPGGLVSAAARRDRRWREFPLLQEQGLAQWRPSRTGSRKSEAPHGAGSAAPAAQRERIRAQQWVAPFSCYTVCRRQRLAPLARCAIRRRLRASLCGAHGSCAD